MNPILNELEAAYVRRFCYEVAINYNNFGPGSIFDYCRDYCHDLEILAEITGIQYDILEEKQVGIPPPLEAPFPWASFEKLHYRTLELQLARQVF